MNRSANPEIEELIANGQRLAKEATQMLEAAEKFFAEHNITPESALEEVRKRGGEKAVAQVRAKVEAEMQKINDEIAQQQMYATKKRPTGRRASTRSMI